MESSKKTQLLYKLFLRGYKNPNSSGGLGNIPQRSHSYNFGHKTNSLPVEPEQRYKKRQRTPDDNGVEPPSPTSASVKIVELSNDDQNPTEISQEPTDKLLDLKWTCSTLDKRRDVIADYFQRSVLKQRQDLEEHEKSQNENNSLYENYCIFLNDAKLPSPEPIYAEICSDLELQKANQLDLEEIRGPQELASVQELSEEEDEHLYENIDIIRHEMLLKQQSNEFEPEEETLVKENGEIDEESILENKPAIKNYWESKMRENAASQFARSQFGIPQSTTIIDKINDEIREDYLRNLELMHDEGLPRSSASDMSDEPIEFDSFDMASSSGSSPFGQPNGSSPLMMAESPTLIDSGHQSQESHVPLENDHDSTDNGSLLEAHSSADEEPQNTHFHKAGSPIYKGYSSSSQPSTPKQGQVNKFAPSVGGMNYRNIVEANKQNAGGRGKIENHVTHYIAFNKPFARTVKPIDEPNLQREKSPPKTQPAVAAEPLEEKFTSLSFKASLNESMQKSSPKSDVSYILATSRLKKEIEDNLKREKELKDQGRVKTLSVDTVSPATNALTKASSFQDLRPEPTRNQETYEKLIIEEERPVVVREEVKKPQVLKEEVKKPQVLKEEVKKPQVMKEEVKKSQVLKEEVKKPQNISPAQPAVTVKKPAPLAAAPKKEPVNRRESLPEVNPPRHIQHIIPNFKIGKNFNSLERYIMYSSLTKLNFRSMGAGGSNGNDEALSPPTVNEPFEFEPVDNVDTKSGKKISNKFGPEDEVFEEEEPVEKVRKNYIPTEKRIQNELQEMIEREEELKRTRQQWKSTPNLSNLTLTEEEEQPVPKVVVPRDTPVRVVNEKRRRSALISKWEDMISKNNQ